MKTSQELTDIRHKEPKALLSELGRERTQLIKDSIAVKLGKFSKTHQLSSRKVRIARILTVLGEKVRPSVKTKINGRANPSERGKGAARSEERLAPSQKEKS